ncbi:Uncharacterised protein [Enterococcus malodoratus]|uniref:Lipoprotein n=1 Tax=Enterococcus malodoratus ATCC 43197 TaxID=1158601 RepID=R2NTP9_9ENTE|nr:hypothetical protein UAI_03199 [Enterococcus malodoratus ATCC 43197]EOT66860.1 hypothetical protein I585_02381 [Enterococcus malodoratus ATCC 43197]OJG65845.1 hypothetical protein RV07_GL001432 [Enterococcus malodoratus]STD69888.1 Uncharacterised protein [Enterococcus malodoratus]
MKKFNIVLLVCSVLVLSACSTNKKAESTDSTRAKLTTSSSRQKKATENLEAIINKFKIDGLTVEASKSMTKDDFGMAPMSAKEAYIFGIQKDDENEYMNARIFSFDNTKDLNKTKTYYDDLGKESAIAFSYTATNEKKKILMQFNGDLSQDLVQKYVDSAGLTLTHTNFTNTTHSSTSSTTDSNNASVNNSTQPSMPQGTGYGDHNANIRDARYQEAIEKGATEQEASDFANGSAPTYSPQTPEPAVENQQSSAQQDADNLSLTDFVNKYGMSPVAWKVRNGMSEEEALRTTTHKTSGEVQLGISKYGIQP